MKNITEFHENLLENQEENSNKNLNGNENGDNNGNIEKNFTPQQNLFEKFRRLGIEGSAEDFLGKNEEEEDSSDPLSYQKIIYELITRQDIQLYIAYERIYKACSGINSIDIISGKIRFNIAFEKLNFMEFLPNPASLQDIKDECLIRKNQKVKIQV